MAGNQYGPRGGPTQEEIDNRKLEELIKICLNTKLSYSTIYVSCQNHSILNRSLPLSNPGYRKVLPTRDISISITKYERPSYTITYNTESNTHQIRKWNQYEPELPKDDLNKIISCIQANTGIVGGRGHRKNKTRNKKRTKRRASRKN